MHISTDHRELILKLLFNEIHNNFIPISQEEYNKNKECAIALEQRVFDASANNLQTYQRYTYIAASYIKTIIDVENPVEHCKSIDIKNYIKLDPKEFEKINQKINDRLENSKIEMAVVTYKTCPKCKARRAQPVHGQTRSADEGGTSVYTCMECSTRFR